jgi:multidrug efflux pump subunit AcrA (membrane-fusion protein)
MHEADSTGQVPFRRKTSSLRIRLSKSRMADYNTLLRTVREKENLVGQARNDVKAAHQALIANRNTPPSKRTALHNAILEHGLASAQIIAHRQSPEYTSAKVELTERQKDVEGASNRGVPTKRYLGLR